VKPAKISTDGPPARAGPLGDLDLRLARETLADRMTNQLRQQILTGRLQPGDLVPTERELREAFGVSRATVREALHGLVTSGYLERRSNQLYVRDRSEIPHDEVDYGELAARLSVEDVYETRKALESAAVKAAARNWADGDIAELRSILERMRPGVGPDYHSADVEFHTAIVRIGRNAVLLQVYEGSKHLFFRLPSFWRVFAGHDRDTARAITGFEGHEPLVDAIERRDADEAVRLNDELLDRVSSTLVRRMSAR
jgi:GntR family transcriptional repressor for pyruvate dehydrogenase complex